MKYREKIKEHIKTHEKMDKPASLADLKGLCDNHQTCLYNIRGLLADNTIRPYIKVDKQIKRSAGFTDNEIFFTLVNNYEYQSDVRTLIKSMCDADANKAFQNMGEFMRLCEERKVYDAQKKAYLIMAGVMPEPEIAQLVYHITYLWKQPRVKEF